MSDVKNEVTIITAFEKLFGLGMEFIIAYNNRELIDLDTGKKFNESKQFDYGSRF
jgi:hypothetical protein